MSARVNLY